MLFEITDKLKNTPHDDTTYEDPELNYSKPIGYFRGSLGYFMTYLDLSKDKKMY
ncbi:MAG: hypothetical protein ACTSRG_12675 [Candidatus Helarchaeota archaeon]